MDGLTHYGRVRRTKSLDILLEQLPKNPRLASNPRFLARNGPRGGGADAGAPAATGGQQKDESFEITHGGLVEGDGQQLSLYDNIRVDEKAVPRVHGYPEGSDAQGQAVPHETAERGSGGMQWMANAVDKILLQRTQMRHQLETLRNSRAYLELSLQDLFAKIDSLELSDTGPEETPSNNVDAIVSAGRSSGADAHRGVFQYQLPWSPVEQEEPGTSQRPPLKFHEILQQTREDLQRVREQETMFGTTLDSLSNSEYRLNEKQKALSRDLKDPQKTARVMKEMLTEGPEPSVARPGTRSATELPTIVEEYFDRRGDIGVWIERQQELDEAYAEGKEERAFIADRGDPLDVADEEFDKQFQARREYIERELEIAQKEADELERRCQAAGHDLAAYRTTARSDTASVMSPSEKPTTSYSPVLQSIRELDSTPVEPQPSGRQPGVSSWLRGLNMDDLEQTEHVITSVPETPVQGPHFFNDSALPSLQDGQISSFSPSMLPDSSERDVEQLNPPDEGQQLHEEAVSRAQVDAFGDLERHAAESQESEQKTSSLPSITLTRLPEATPETVAPAIQAQDSRQLSTDTANAASKRLSTHSSADYQTSAGPTDPTPVAPPGKDTVADPTKSNTPRLLHRTSASDVDIPRAAGIWESFFNPVEPQPARRQTGVRSWLRALNNDMEKTDHTNTGVPETPIREPQILNAPVFSSSAGDLPAAISEAMFQGSSERDLKRQSAINEQQRSSTGEQEPGKELMDMSHKEERGAGPRPSLPSITWTSNGEAQLTKSWPEMYPRESREDSFDASQAPSRRLSTSEAVYSADYQASTSSTDQTSLPSKGKAQVLYAQTLDSTASNAPRPLDEGTSSDNPQNRSFWGALLPQFLQSRSP